MEGAAIDGHWRLVEVDGSGGPVNLGNIVGTLWVDSSAGKMGFRITNSVSGKLVLEGNRLRLVPEVTTLVKPGGVRAVVESTVESMLRSGSVWDATTDHLRLSDDEGRALRYQRLTAVE